MPEEEKQNIQQPQSILPTPSVPVSGLPVPPTIVAGVNPTTRLTSIEQALLSPTEQLIRQRQRTA